LSNAPSPFHFSYFSDIGSHSFWLRLAADCDPPTYASCIAGMTGMYHHARLVL
jgi:hypothetical protein